MIDQILFEMTEKNLSQFGHNAFFSYKKISQNITAAFKLLRTNDRNVSAKNKAVGTVRTLARRATTHRVAFSLEQLGCCTCRVANTTIGNQASHQRVKDDDDARIPITDLCLPLSAGQRFF